MGDIPELVNHFLRRVFEDTDRANPGMTEEAIERLMQHRWPGNVRELENAVRFAVIKSQGEPIQARHFPPQVKGDAISKPARPPRSSKLDRQLVQEALETTSGNKSEAARHLGVARATLYRFLGENRLSW
jgi:DNA-binding NtrC family response regulator